MGLGLAVCLCVSFCALLLGLIRGNAQHTVLLAVIIQLSNGCWAEPLYKYPIGV
jgi:hypothetical protein